MSEEILKVVDLVKTFGGIRAVDGISLEVDKSSIVGLIGPNGSGKTTLFNAITGFYPPDSGEIYFEGKRIDGLSPKETYKLGLVRTFQNPRLFKEMTVLENLLIPPKEQKGEGLLTAPFERRWDAQEEELTKKALGLSEIFKLRGLERGPTSDMSGGHMKLLETSRGLMGNPRMLLLDEPAAGVTYSVAKQIFDHVTELRGRLGLTFLIVEHRIDILLDYVDKVYVLHLGKVIFEGSPKDARNDRGVIEAYLGD